MNKNRDNNSNVENPPVQAPAPPGQTTSSVYSVQNPPLNLRTQLPVSPRPLSPRPLSPRSLSPRPTSSPMYSQIPKRKKYVVQQSKSNNC